MWAKDFGAYHAAWWIRIKPFIFPVTTVAFLGSVSLVWLRPAGDTSTPVWLNVGLQVLIYSFTAAFWRCWQARTQFARLPDGSLDAM